MDWRRGQNDINPIKPTDPWLCAYAPTEKHKQRINNPTHRNIACVRACVCIVWHTLCLGESRVQQHARMHCICL